VPELCILRDVNRVEGCYIDLPIEIETMRSVALQEGERVARQHGDT